MRKTPIIPIGALLIEEYIVALLSEDVNVISLGRQPLDSAAFDSKKIPDAVKEHLKTHVHELFELKRKSA